MLLDLQVLAYQADLTRVTTFMLARELSNRSYAEIGVPGGFHGLSHHGNDPEKIADMAKINAYHSSMVAYFLERLDAVQDGDGSLLDQAVILFGSGMGNSNQHEPRQLPLVVAGGGGGRLEGGRHVRYPSGTVLSDLHVALLNKLDVPVESIGDSSGPLSLDA